MKIPLPDQIAEARRHRDSLEALRAEGVTYTEGPDLETRLHRAEGIVLTLEFIKTYESEFRQFMANRKDA